MSQENVQALREGYEAFGRGDIDAAFATFADDIVWKGNSDLVPAGGTYHGIDEIKSKWLPEFGANFQDFRQEIQEVIDAGEYVIVLGTSRATVAGQQIKDSFCHVWKFSGDKATEATFFGDNAQVLQALQKQEATA